VSCYLSSFKVIIYKYLFFIKNKYVELGSENMGVYWHWLILYIVIFYYLFIILNV